MRYLTLLLTLLFFCINHANEKLQNLFNEHVFSKEKKVYLSDGLALDSLPPHRDNTPCVQLVEEKRKFVGLMAALDDKKDSKDATDQQFCGNLLKVKAISYTRMSVAVCRSIL